MRITLTLLTLCLFLFSCRENSESKLNSGDASFEPADGQGLSKLPDSLRLMNNMLLIEDFNADDITDFAAVVQNKYNEQIGVVIMHSSSNSETFVFGAGKEVSGMTNLHWVEVFDLLPKGKLVAPTLVDKQTGDIIGPDKSKEFKLIAAGISMSVEEGHGGGILFWDGSGYRWYHVE
ncbi:hypothetical protein [Gilvibacter sediminis]|uniref:hypothetical protein n=1 Tax=Gilvibacter sediminis TaxID=379071 RepID=UPI002350F802|nr:hypothetical protein [Gilvibacter sediminis]MDC7997706.1 hypothetical protein [Gilvibacter sediminis]